MHAFKDRSESHKPARISEDKLDLISTKTTPRASLNKFAWLAILFGNHKLKLITFMLGRSVFTRANVSRSSIRTVLCAPPIGAPPPRQRARARARTQLTNHRITRPDDRLFPPQKHKGLAKNQHF